LPPIAILGRDFAKLVRLGVEGTSGPAEIGQVDVGVLTVKTSELLVILQCVISPHKGGWSGQAHFKYFNCEQKNFLHESVLPPPVSVSIAWRLFSLNQSARGPKVSATLSVTHSVCVPELSESRYSVHQESVDEPVTWKKLSCE